MDHSGDFDSKPKTPRWVKVFGIIGILVAALVVAILLLSGGEHGPGRHAPGSHSPGHTISPSVPVGHTPAEGGHA